MYKKKYSPQPNGNYLRINISNPSYQKTKDHMLLQIDKISQNSTPINDKNSQQIKVLQLDNKYMQNIPQLMSYLMVRN